MKQRPQIYCTKVQKARMWDHGKTGATLHEIGKLFDKWYYRTVGTSTLGNYYGEPRNWMLTLRGRF